jgi:hypothetical protein
MKIPRDLKPDDIIVDNHGVRRAFISYLLDGGALTESGAAFRPNGERFFRHRGHAVRIERIGSKAKRKKVDKDIAYCIKVLDAAKPTHLWEDGTYDHNGGHSRMLSKAAVDLLTKRLRAIARRLNKETT